MKFANTPQLKEWLERDHPELAAQADFDIDPARFHAFRKQLHAQGDHKHPNREKEADVLDLAALFAALTYQEAKKPAEACFVSNTGAKPPEPETIAAKPETQPSVLVPEAASIMLAVRSLRTWLRLIAVILLLLLAKTVHGQSIASGDITGPLCG